MTNVDLFLRFGIHSFEWVEEGMAAGPVLGTKVFTHLQEREGKGKKATQMRPMKRTGWIKSWWESGRGGKGGGRGAKANLFTRSLKYKLQEARTFWWTSNSLPSTIIFRSVNSFVLRCWFNSFNISVEEEKETNSAIVRLSRFFFCLFFSYIHAYTKISAWTAWQENKGADCRTHL